MSRQTLKHARKSTGMTQQGIADHLFITLRYYKKIESGESLGSIELWDSLEDLFAIHQRKLRELSKNCHVQEDSQSTHLMCQLL